MRNIRLLLAVLLAAAPLSALCETPPPTAAPETPGTLAIHVALVATDLSIKPVPKSRFILRSEPADGASTAAREIVTGFDGIFQVELTAGSYRLVSAGPVELDGSSYTWDLPFQIVAGKVLTLELSNDNARTTTGSRRHSQVTEEGEIYQRFKDSVFKIVADSGHGTGFLVSGDGLILTNHHVVAESRYLAARFADGRKHALRVLAQDPRRDLAVVQAHPDTVRGLAVFSLSDDQPDSQQVSVGQRVVAIGNPLTAEALLTSGLVSKIEDESIFSDVNLNPGNSGGPLLDLSGRVIGVTTFGLDGDSGPGVAGVVRIHLAAPLIAQARAESARAEPPSARGLPEASSYRLSPEEVKRLARTADRKADDYHLEVGKFDVHLVTPVMAAASILRRESEAAAARDKRVRKQGQRGDTPTETTQAEASVRGFYEWQKNSENFRPSVIVRIDPEVKVQVGSAFKAALVGTGAKYRFKADFDRMELWRDDQIVEPIHPGRIRVVVHAGNVAASMKDVGYFGAYEYPPEAFRPGAALKLKVWMQNDAPAIETFIDPALIQRIFGDFAPYFAHVDAVPAVSPASRQ